MAKRHITGAAALLLALATGACATHRGEPQPIPVDASAELTPEFHAAAIGHDALRGALTSEN